MRRLTQCVFVASLTCLALPTTSAQAQKTTRPLPAVDKAAPAKVETASFALG